MDRPLIKKIRVSFICCL